MEVVVTNRDIYPNVITVRAPVPVRGIIFDSGGVLIRPIGGDWFPTVSLTQVLAEHGISWQRDRLNAARAAADAYLDSVHVIPLRNEDDERPVMARYHQTMLETIGVTGDLPSLARRIQAREEARQVVECCEWALEVLAELHARGVPMVILSNAWPSLRRLHRALGLDRFISGMVISAEEGVAKPDPRVYHKALALLGLLPEQALFIDDDPGHVEAAVRLGLRGIRLRGDGRAPALHLEEITDLRAVLAVVGDASRS